MKARILKSEGYDPYRNLALEEYLFRQCERDHIPCLYLWQNDNTVVIGLNQSAYSECDIKYCVDNKIKISRRMTGGGAVFQDLGNLNYSFICPIDMYDIRLSTDVVIRALRKLGIDLGVSGRNDMVIGDAKISGNAYYKNDKAGLHHGTILYDLTNNQMSKALTASRSKLVKHGIKSVQARVGDIHTVVPTVVITDVMNAIKESFVKTYGVSECLTDLNLNDDYERLFEKYSSEEWIFNRVKKLELSSRRQFDWAEVELTASYNNGEISEVDIITDSLETDVVETVRKMVNESISRNVPLLESFDQIKKEHAENIDKVNDIQQLFMDVSMGADE